MNPIVVIPARMASTRLPGKPLADICGQPMVVHVWRRVSEATIGPVVVACAEQDIATAVQAAGGKAVLTYPGHPSGSDRVFEAVQIVDPVGYYDVVVNVQGDLPTLDSHTLKVATSVLNEPAVDIATLVTHLTDPCEAIDKNVVKAAVGFTAGTAPGTIARVLYFSRAIVPSGPGPLFRHIGIYAYRRTALERFIAFPPSELEVRERLEQLRALENGLCIKAALVKIAPFGVDTYEDLISARVALMRYT